MASYSFTVFIIAALLAFQAIGIYGQTAGVITGVAETPAYNGSWYLCSDTNTNYISFSLHVLSNQSTPLTEGLPGNLVPGNPPVPLPKFRPGLFVFQSLQKEMPTDAKDPFNYVPSLSCYEKPVQICDQDVGEILLPFKDKQCVLTVNPTALPVRFNVSVSFNTSVFNTSFTSPDQPGGNNQPKAVGNETNTPTAAFSTPSAPPPDASNAPNTPSIATKNYNGFINLIFTTLISILIYNAIEMF